MVAMIEGTGLFFAKIMLQQYLLVCGLNMAVDCYKSFGKELSIPLDKILSQAWPLGNLSLTLVPFALAQALGGSTGIFTWLGLTLAMLPSMIYPVVFIAVSVLSGQMPQASDGNRFDPDQEWPEGPGGVIKKVCAPLAKILPTVAFLGALMLTFAEVPSGICLGCISMCLRLGLFVELVLGHGCVLVSTYLAKFKETAVKFQDAAQVAASLSFPFIPIASALALADHTLWGPSSGLLAVFHPALYYMLWQVLQFATAFGVPVFLGGSVRRGVIDGTFDAEVGNKPTLVSKLLVMGMVANVVLYGSMFLMMFRLVFALFSMDFSFEQGITFQTGPLLMVACLFALVTFVKIYVAQFALGMVKEFTGFEMPMLNDMISTGKGVPQLSPVVAFTIIAIYAEIPANASGFFANLMWFVGFPYTYGIMLPVWAMVLQAFVVIVFFLAFGERPDLGEVVLWPKNELPKPALARIMRLLRVVVYACWIGGFLLAWVALGLLVWIVVLIPIVALSKDKILEALPKAKEGAKSALASTQESVNKYATEAKGPTKKVADVVGKSLDALSNILNSTQTPAKPDTKKKK